MIQRIPVSIRFSSIRFSAGLLFAVVVFYPNLGWSDQAVADALSADPSDRATGILTLTNGDAFAGQLRPSDDTDAIRWMNDDFLDPFAFEMGAIESIRYPYRTKFQSDENFVIECVDGDVVCGQIIDWSADRIQLRSQQLGIFAIGLDHIRHIHRSVVGQGSGVVFATGLSDWQTPGWTTDGWTDHGDHLGSSTPGAALNGDFHIPPRAFIDIELSWDAIPDFVLALASDPTRDADSDRDGWRMETAENQLILIRERESTADVDVVRDLGKLNRLRMYVFLDQEAGVIRVHLPSGEEIARVVDRTAAPTGTSDSLGTGIRLINRSGLLRVNRLRIVAWNGGPPWEELVEPIHVHTIGGEPIAGTFDSFDPRTGTLTVTTADKSGTARLSEMASVQFRTRGRAAGLPPSVFRLRDGSQVSGKVQQVTATHWVVSSRKFIDRLSIPRDQVHHVSMSSIKLESNHLWTAKIGQDVEGRRIGRIHLPNSQHLGWIADSVSDRVSPQQDSDLPDLPRSSEATEGTSAIRWQPCASLQSSRLASDVSGRIVYVDGSRDHSFGRSGNSSPSVRSLSRVSDKQFGTLFLESVDRIESRRARRDQHVVHLASGDVIACRIESIGPSGVTMSTAGQDNVVVADEEIKAIELIKNADLPELSDAKQTRLLTLPRLQKPSPPTHILCSSDGDLLRCRLLRANQSTVEVEVQMEPITIDRDRISHIIWLHPEQMSAQDPTELRYNGRVQVVSLDQKRMTFRPTRTTDGRLRGVSDILGACDIDLSKISQIVLGDEIANESQMLKYAEWKLHNAIEPLIMQAVVDDQPSSASSRLIGQPAPKIVLERLDGGTFDLSDYRGRVVVLDFWASWCAPCLQSMPDLKRTIDQFDSTQVALIGVNLEERRDVAAEAIVRMGIDLVVALDVDGDTAAIYRASAIPQTVIIDANGRVADVVVGGERSTADSVEKIVNRLID